MMARSRPSRTRLYRNSREGRICGVIAGLADYLGINVSLLRLAVIGACFFFAGPVVIGYIILAIALDDLPGDLYGSKEEKEFWRDVHTEPSGTTKGLRHKFRNIERRLRELEALVTSSQYELRRKFRDIEDD